MQREVQQLKAASSGKQGQQQQTNLVSLDSWSQAGGDAGGWDAFSNHTDASRQTEPHASAQQQSAMSPLSPQRQAAAAQAQAFIKAQTSNVQSMQVAPLHIL